MESPWRGVTCRESMVPLSSSSMTRPLERPSTICESLGVHEAHCMVELALSS